MQKEGSSSESHTTQPAVIGGYLCTIDRLYVHSVLATNG